MKMTSLLIDTTYAIDGGKPKTHTNSIDDEQALLSTSLPYNTPSNLQGINISLGVLPKGI